MSAEARAERKMLARLYASMPTKDTFEAATRYEQTKMQAAQMSATSIFQLATFMGQIAGNLPPTEERNRHLADKARTFIDKYIDEANIQLEEYIAQSAAAREAQAKSAAEDDGDEEPEQEEPPLAS